ncbi:hypothetical protein [Mycoplasma suis]|uniref:Uncharacterized protein n=1 Tax=Mycoplasma suis (strain Illinois) TaxID=768700 RepID=F0QRN4_MYCSL|nr:hypothetical protein [Mycoplasma suis]ADX98154.1 hypothetical protein MSU_0622 [Mycoplasma suis str. Illinois]
MNHLTRGFIFLGSIAWLSGTGYLLANTFTSKSKNKGSKEVINLHTPKTKGNSSEFLWRYIFVNESSKKCDFFKQDAEKSESDRKKEYFELDEINCEEVFPEIKVRGNYAKTFFWIEGIEREVEKILKSEELILLEFQKKNWEVLPKIMNLKN